MKKNTLSVLAQPEVIEELDYDVLLKRRLGVLKREAARRGVDISEITELRTDPGRILLEEASYAEMAIRSRQNHIYRSRLLYFAKGADLDHVAEEYGVTRLENEPDEDLRIRVRIHNRGSSAAGPDDWWRFHAMKADERVEDVAVIRVPIGPHNQQRGLVRLSILAETPDGVPGEDVLENVRAHVTSDAVRPLGSKVEVVAATSRPVTVRAHIWLLPETQHFVFEKLETGLKQAFADTRALGWDVTPSWIIGQLQQNGVQRVELLEPTSVIKAAPGEAPLLKRIHLELMGYDR